MSDQLFKGLLPKHSVGKEYFFYCKDFCYSLCDLIANEVGVDLIPFNGLDEEESLQLCIQLQEVVDSGRAAKFYRGEGKRYGMSKSEISVRVELMIDITESFGGFLLESGGCEAVYR